MYATDGAAMGLRPSGNPVVSTAVSDCNPNNMMGRRDTGEACRSNLYCMEIRSVLLERLGSDSAAPFKKSS